MKRNIIYLGISQLILVCTLSTSLWGQSDETMLKKIYLQGGGGASSQSGSGGEVGVQAIWKKNWSTTFSYQNVSMEPKGMPSDYQPGYGFFLLLPVEDENPVSDATFYNFTAGKCFPAGRKVWFTMEAGISFVNGEKYTFTRQEVKSEYFFIGYSTTSNYSIKTEKATAVGGTIRADVTWAFSSFAGLGFGVYANMNSVQSPVGFNVKFVTGWMNTKRKK